VRHNRCQLTNLSWHLDGEHMAKELEVPKVELLNDFAAVAYGCLTLKGDDVWTLNEVPYIMHAPIACIGAGTGLGQAYLTSDGHQYDVWSSEGGHADFGPRNDLELKLVQFISDSIQSQDYKGVDQDRQKLHRDFVRVSVERVVAGPGIENIYKFLSQQYSDRISQQVSQQLLSEGSSNWSKIISQHAIDRTDPLCEEAMQIFVRTYGAEAGNLALKLLPYGGLYVAGGIAPKIIDIMKRDNLFMNHMCHKGRLRPFLERIPVYVIKGHIEAGLRGSQVLAKRVLNTLFSTNFAYEVEPQNRIFSEDDFLIEPESDDPELAKRRQTWEEQEMLAQ